MSRELLELAPGSRWADDDELVDDCSSKHAIVFPVNERAYLISSSRFGMTGIAYTADAIALLHRAGLLDELLAEAWSSGYNSGHAKEEPTNPYRKAGK